jgi:hypothetical protein
MPRVVICTLRTSKMHLALRTWRRGVAQWLHIEKRGSAKAPATDRHLNQKPKGESSNPRARQRSVNQRDRLNLDPSRYFYTACARHVLSAFGLQGAETYPQTHPKCPCHSSPCIPCQPYCELGTSWSELIRQARKGEKMQNREFVPISITGATAHQDGSGYLSSVTSRRLIDPVLLFEASPLVQELKEKDGGTAISAADVLKSFQFHSELYFGATTPQARTEAPHWHTDQWEAYVMIKGEAEMLAKHRWVPNGWITKVASAGDVLLVQPEVCHWFRWQSAFGLCYVFKAPQRAGLGPFPAGKVTCDRGCPENKNGCVYPSGWCGPQK